METEDEITSFMSATTKATSWSIINGSLNDTITYESSISPAEVSETTVCGPPLLLRRPEPDSGPCEITLCFAQRHEIKQVYVRSTARVYEIYCAAKAKSDNEYFCTVRCSMAAKSEKALELARDEADLQAAAVGSSVCVGFNGSPEHFDEGELKGDSVSSSNEDGWVDVKVPVGDGSPSKKDFYEATAEISDAEPCISLTLRLPLVQSRESVYIDEVYIFADPVLSDELDSPPSRVESSTTSAMMSMLIPTLLQLSRSRAGQSDKRNDNSIVERRQSQDTDKSIQTPRIQRTADQSMATQEPNSAFNYQTCSKVPTQAPEVGHIPENNYYSRLESILEQLVSRVARMEDFCLRFEESIRKPVTSLETRLERIEKQLELLNKNSGLSTVPSCTRFSAPEFSCNESEPNSFYSDGDHHSRFETSESFKKDEFASRELSVLPSDDSLSVNANQLHPSLVVTAPDFLSLDDEDEDEDEDDAPEAMKDPLKDNVKKTVSIDDALAAALAGFLSSTQPPDVPKSMSAHSSGEGRDHTVIVKHDERTVSSSSTDQSSGEAFGEVVATFSDDGKHDKPIVPSFTMEQSSGNAVVEVAVSTSNVASAEGDLQDITSPNCTVLSLVEKKQGHLLEETSSGGVCLGCIIDHHHYDVGANETSNASVVTEKTEFGIGDACASDESTEDPVQLYEGDIAGSRKEVAMKCADVLQDVLNIPNPLVLNLDFPILDVKFVSPEDSASHSSLKELLTNGLEYAEVPCVEERTGAMNGEKNQDFLIKINDRRSEDVLQQVEERMEVVNGERNQNFLIEIYDFHSEDVLHQHAFLMEGPEDVEFRGVEEGMGAANAEQSRDILVHVKDQSFGDVLNPEGGRPLDSREEVVSLI